MKKLNIFMCLLLSLSIISCDDYLDINDNPNQATEVSPSLVLPQAMAGMATVLNGYNNYGMQIGGYAANAGGFGGFNETVSYAYTPNNYAGLWPATYDNLEDFQYIIDATMDDESSSNYFGVAKIMRVYGFQLLVDTYNNIPYSQALKGANELTPSYDNATEVYKGLANELDEAIEAINFGKENVVKSIDDFDIIFGGDMDNWLKLANTLKLRLMVRAKGKVTFDDTSFDPIGFLTEDVLINPGYLRDNNRQNPKWNNWGFGYTGNAGNLAWIPTTFVMTFYDGTKLDDPGRGGAMFYEFPTTGTNQLGYEGTGIAKSPEGSFWYPGSNRTGTSAGNSTGVLKGPDAGFPLLIAAESYFLQAEAILVSIPGVSGTAKAHFEDGIEASFTYLYTLPNGDVSGDPESDADDYINDNASRLVQYDLASTDAQRLEAIITQKYIALNMIHSQEGWNEYRRTGYPTLSMIGSSVTRDDATTTFASLASQSTRADKLPSRVLYPQTEIQYNPENVPSGVNSFTSLIFWAK